MVRLIHGLKKNKLLTVDIGVCKEEARGYFKTYRVEVINGHSELLFRKKGLGDVMNFRESRIELGQSSFHYCEY